MQRKNLTILYIKFSLNIAAKTFLSLKLLSEFEPWVVSVCISKYKIHFPVYLVLISFPFPDLAESVMCLFLFGLAGTWLAFCKLWLNLIQGQFSYQACWGSQQAFKPIFTVTDHLERVAGKAGQEVTEYLFFSHSSTYQFQHNSVCKHFQGAQWVFSLERGRLSSV